MLAVLVKGDYLAPAAAAMLKRFMARWQVSAFEALMQTALLPEGELATALASLYHVDRLHHLDGVRLAADAPALVPFPLARQEAALLAAAGEGRLELIVADPSPRDLFDVLKQGLKRELTLAVAERSDILRAIDELYPLPAQLPHLFGRA
jgi:hypothetical protein